MLFKFLCLFVLPLLIHAEPADLRWDKLTRLPDKEGYAGMFAGISNGALIAAGGANFPGKKPWKGGEKVWYDTIFALESPDGKWQIAEQKISQPLAYGVSITTDEGLLCIGGGNAGNHSRKVFLLQWKDGAIQSTAWPELPQACAFMSGARIGDVVYVAGGLERPGATQALHTFWSLNLKSKGNQRKWQKLEAWPGPGRHLSVTGVAKGALHLCSGVMLKAGAEGKAERIIPYLNDAYRFTPGANNTKGQWSRLPNMPRAVAAAPSPAMSAGSSLLIMGGVDGSMVGRKVSTHRGFTRDILGFDARANTWSYRGKAMNNSSRVTAPAVVWDGAYVLVSGERAPGRRSPNVYRVAVKEEKSD
ncbi:MAG: galactose oxidase [Planctomycetota bacterium]|nr:galactose oxidase [Planctomycetota bacterium]MDP7130440.1 galactose oxidase [Planctomycetota bacterium]MDP7249325.1 galactose oxidase [Planctomycetota bacterium]